MARKKSQPGTGYEQHKEQARERQAAQSRTGRDIGEIPPVANPERRAACELDFRAFCETYFAPAFYLGWSKDHLTVIDKIEKSITQGGLFALAMPRGSGKSTICEFACIWAVLYGHRSFVAMIGAEAKHAAEMLKSIKTELESNDLLEADFPEVCYPIVRLEGISNRCKGQRHSGEPTNISWTRDEIILPTIAGSKASGSIIKVAGITGRVRGMKHKQQDGTIDRPDLVIVDDPQTAKSARSRSQCETREEILKGDVLGLSGPGKRIAGVMPCTVINPGDMADTILDRAKHPEWCGERMKAVYRWPDREDLWQQYAELWSDGMRGGDDGASATEFYRKNRAEMDRGAEVAWSEKFDDNEISGIQHVHNKRLTVGDAAFAAEFQNQPEVDSEKLKELTADEVAEKINRIRRAVVPLAVTKLTAFIDVQGDLLYWLVAGWEDDFTGYVVDYGAYPDQRRPYFTLRQANPKLSDIHPIGGLEGALYAGLEAVTANILGRPWRREGETEQRIEKCLIDANWGESTDLVYQFCRQSAHAAILTPSHGKGIGSKGRPMSEWTASEGEKIGFNWRLSAPRASKRAIRHVLIDTNFWKSFIHTRLAVPMGGRGCLSLFGDRPNDHRLFAEHVTVETRIREGEQRKVDVWKLPSNKPDNHWFDGLCGAAVAASMLGCKLDAGALAGAEAPPSRPKRKTLGQAMAEKQGVIRR